MLVVAINAHGENEVKMKSIRVITSGILQLFSLISLLPANFVM